MKAKDCRYYSRLADRCDKGLPGTECERTGCHAYHPTSDSDLRISVAKLREVLNRYVTEYTYTRMCDDDVNNIINEVKSEI